MVQNKGKLGTEKGRREVKAEGVLLGWDLDQKLWPQRAGREDHK